MAAPHAPLPLEVASKPLLVEGGEQLTLALCCKFDAGTGGRCGVWRRSTCPWRCGIICVATLLTLLVAFTILCIASLCCIEVDCAKFGGAPSGSVMAQTPLVFVHGFSGSFLQAADGSVAYLTALQALGVGASDLSLPLAWVGNASQQDDVSAWSQAKDGLTAGAPLDDIRFAGCVRVAVYSKPLSWLRRCANRPTYSFAYDWRRDNWETAAALKAFIKGVAATHNRSVQLLGHSNGGVLSMVATGLLGEEAIVTGIPSPVHSSVFAATPFGGGYGTLAPFTNGYIVGLSNTLSLSAPRLLSISSYFTYLPLTPADWTGAGASFLHTPAGAQVDLNLVDPAVWLTMGLSPLLTSTTGAAYVSLAASLRRAALVRSYLRPRPGVAYPPAAVIASTQWPTKRNYTISNVGLIDWSSGTEVTGDGSVRFDAAQPPYPTTGVFSPSAELKLTHSYVLDDLVTLQKALASTF
jgi:hypothetical protein